MEKKLKIKDVAPLLGYARRTLYAKCARGEIPCINTGRHILFDPQTLEAWLKTKEIKTSAQLQEEAERRLKNENRK